VLLDRKEEEGRRSDDGLSIGVELGLVETCDERLERL